MNRPICKGLYLNLDGTLAKPEYRSCCFIYFLFFVGVLLFVCFWFLVFGVFVVVVVVGGGGGVENW